MKLSRFWLNFSLRPTAVSLWVVSALGLSATDAVARHASLQVCNNAAAQCSYSAIQDAVDAAVAGDTIAIGPGVFKGSVYLGNKKNLRIIGAGRTRTIILGGPIPPVPPHDDTDAINCSGGGKFFLRGVTITHTFGDHGPGIHNHDCTITVERSTIQTNLASLQGGGIYNSGTLTLRGVDVLDNVSESGGGIYNVGQLTIRGGHIMNNSAQFPPLGGGGIFNSGTATLFQVVISGNDAVRGGGIENAGGTMSVVKSSIHRNHARYYVVSGQGLDSGQGGGIWNSGKLQLAGSMIDFNAADLKAANRQGGGVLTQPPGTMINDDGTSLFYENAPNDCADATGTVACP